MTDGASSFKRRKFTITESLDAVLLEMAEVHYQGNVSLCLRAAIESHRSLLRNDEHFATDRLFHQLQLLEDQQVDLQEALESLSNEGPAPERSFPPTGQLDVNVAGPVRLVHSEFNNSIHPLHIEDITERLELPTDVVYEAVTTLADLGLITTVDGDSRRFGLVGKKSYREEPRSYDR